MMLSRGLFLLVLLSLALNSSHELGTTPTFSLDDTADMGQVELQPAGDSGLRSPLQLESSFDWGHCYFLLRSRNIAALRCA
jgi:hypothetical protein